MSTKIISPLKEACVLRQGKEDSPKHVVHSIVLGSDQERNGATPGAAGGAPMEKLSDAVDAGKTGRFVRITIEKLGTVYGCSLWEVRVFGMHVD